MATTNSNLPAGTAIGEQGGSGNGVPKRTAGLLATATLGLGLLAGILLGQAYHTVADGQGTRAVGPSRVSVALGDRDDPRFGGPQSVAPAPQAVIALGDRDDPRFGVPATQGAGAFVPDQFTYREDHRVSSAAIFVPDQFTYREDHRAGTTTPLVPALPTYRESHGMDGTIVVVDQFTYREDHRGDR